MGWNAGVKGAEGSHSAISPPPPPLSIFFKFLRPLNKIEGLSKGKIFLVSLEAYL